MNLSSPNSIFFGAFVVALFSYFLGSIPFSFLVVKAAKKGNILAQGSGNAGTTNAWRVAGKFCGLATFFLDSGKAIMAVVLAKYLMHTSPAFFETVAALFVLLGHIFPVWLKGKGGKGVASFLALQLVLCWPIALALYALWGVFIISFRYVSVASILVCALAPPLYLLVFIISVALQGQPYAPPTFGWITLSLSALIIAKHAPNIRRLGEGSEPKIPPFKPRKPMI